MKPLLLVLVGVLAFVPAHGTGKAPSEVADVLDRFHRAAAEADGKVYFDLFAPDAVFLGTAAEERWTIEEFQAFARPYFSAGRGWTYVVREAARNVIVSPAGDVAWFDEILDNAKYGECRGTGVLRRIDDRWKIEQYNLTIPLPNEIALDVVGMIRALAPPDARADEGPSTSPLEAVESLMRAFNDHDVEAMLTHVTDDVEWLSVEGTKLSVEAVGKGALKKGMTSYFNGMPGVRSTIEDPTVHGRYVTVRERAFWTGDDGEERSQASLAVYEIRENLVARVWYYPAE